MPYSTDDITDYLDQLKPYGTVYHTPDRLKWVILDDLGEVLVKGTGVDPKEALRDLFINFRNKAETDRDRLTTLASKLSTTIVNF
jgi:hypothetical protein